MVATLDALPASLEAAEIEQPQPSIAKHQELPKLRK